MGVKIAITTSSFGKYVKKPLDILQDRGFDLYLNPYGRTLKGDEIIKVCKDAVGIIAGTEILDSRILEELSSSSNKDSLLRVISRCGVGMDNVDLDTAKKLGINVFNTLDAPTIAVAELTVGLILNLLRKINMVDRLIRNDKWEKLMGNLLTGKKVGIIGLGRIGKKVAEMLLPFGCEISYTDPIIKDEVFGLKCMTFEELITWAEIISIHTSTKERLFGEKEFGKMKEGVWIVNTSRGSVIDEAILYQYLKRGSVKGAALDVFDHEPYSGALRECDNIILTPHIGSYAMEARTEMEMLSVNNLLKGLEKEVIK